MTNLSINTYINKNNGDVLTASEWRALFSAIQSKINAIIAYINGYIKYDDGKPYINGDATKDLALEDYIDSIAAKDNADEAEEAGNVARQN